MNRLDQTNVRSSRHLLFPALIIVWLLANAPLLGENAPTKIRRVDLVHMTHTDIGFTDHPAVTRELQKRYFDVAIDAVLADQHEEARSRFCWTAEVTLSVDDWWRSAEPERRQAFFQALDTGRLEIAALAMNQTSLLNAAEWEMMLRWLPERVWEKAQPQVGIQNDVNGFPRAGAIKLLDRNVPFLWSGINTTNGAAPFRQPSAFWWKMPDGRRLFVWLGEHYARGYYYFHPTSWRQGPVPEATDTRYRPPRPGEFFRADEASVRAAHAHLLGQLSSLEASGYDYPTLVLSVTNEWRIDNDPPFPPLADFVATWNRLQLAPELRLMTASRALEDLRSEIGDRIPEHQGEWPDWWANGSASGPREIAASRKAKRLTAAALSSVWGPADKSTRKAADQIYRSLCLFDEHTWGAADSVGLPHAIETWGQYNEKARCAYHALGMAKLLLASRARSTVYPGPPGLYVVNTAPAAWRGWVTIPSTCLRQPRRSLVDMATNSPTPLKFNAGYAQFGRPSGPEQVTDQNTAETIADLKPEREVRFWVDTLESHATRRYALSDEDVTIESTPDERQITTMPAVTTDQAGWPVRAVWDGMEHPLFDGPAGEVVQVALEGFAARWDAMDVRRDPNRRRQTMTTSVAQPIGKTEVEQNSHTTLFTQRLKHPRLLWGSRQLELFHDTPRARITVRFDRASSEKPEWFFIGFALPCDGAAPVTTCGGMPFQPFADQLPNTCSDYFGIDGWVAYPTPSGTHLWTSRDAPLIRFDKPQLEWAVAPTPHTTDRIYAMVFDNTWFTNFVADSHGLFEFQFDLAWSAESVDPVRCAKQAASLMAEPQVILHPDLTPDPIYLEHLRGH
jgi:hypothetical protein